MNDRSNVTATADFLASTIFASTPKPSTSTKTFPATRSPPRALVISGKSGPIACVRVPEVGVVPARSARGPIRGATHEIFQRPASPLRHRILASVLGVVTIACDPPRSPWQSMAWAAGACPSTSTTRPPSRGFHPTPIPSMVRALTGRVQTGTVLRPPQRFPRAPHRPTIPACSPPDPTPPVRSVATAPALLVVVCPFRRLATRIRVRKPTPRRTLALCHRPERLDRVPCLQARRRRRSQARGGGSQTQRRIFAGGRGIPTRTQDWAHARRRAV